MPCESLVSESLVVPESPTGNKEQPSPVLSGGRPLQDTKCDRRPDLQPPDNRPKDPLRPTAVLDITRGFPSLSSVFLPTYHQNYQYQLTKNLLNLHTMSPTCRHLTTIWNPPWPVILDVTLVSPFFELLPPPPNILEYFFFFAKTNSVKGGRGVTHLIRKHFWHEKISTRFFFF